MAYFRVRGTLARSRNSMGRLGFAELLLSLYRGPGAARNPKKLVAGRLPGCMVVAVMALVLSRAASLPVCCACLPA